MPFKSPLEQAESFVGKEVDIPYQKGVKGKIIDDVKDTYGVEYTTPKGITRKDRFYKNEFKNPSDQSDALLKEAGWSDYRIRNAKRTNAKKHPGILEDYQKEKIKPYPLWNKEGGK